MNLFNYLARFFHVLFRASAVAAPARCSLGSLEQQLECEPEMQDRVIRVYATPDAAALVGAAELSTCVVKNCLLVSDHEMRESAQAAIFTPQDAPLTNRSAAQLGIMLLLESPPNTPRLSEWNGKINYTAAYHSKSDIPAPYGLIKRRTRPLRAVGQSKRKKKEAPIVENENDLQIKRAGFCGLLPTASLTVGERSSWLPFNPFVPIDIYGACGRGRITPDQRIALMNSHRFYLAFENSRCEEYVTEKFFDALRHNILPVVYGTSRETLERIAPPHSFVHVDDFAGVGELGSHLHHLATNQTAYDAYFEWKRLYYLDR
ncbi:Glyco-tran-10-N domain-containing protein [Aphelenchoides fujianensis]|nr:Glyco-tran-10-N domain-containing protein [Aphelenchoides fujianensis]